MTAPRGERGFTLISVMVAIVILTVGLLALARSQSLLARSQSDTGNFGVAYGLARSYMEELRGRDPRTLATEAAVALDRDGQPNAAGPFRRTTEVTGSGANLVQVTVRVDYPRAARPAEIVTMVYREAP